MPIFQNIITGIQTGLSVYGALQGQGGSGGGGQQTGCLHSQVSGDQAMTRCVPVVMALFDQLASQAPSMTAQAVAAAANQIAGIFSDTRYFNQTIGGRSREIREAAKIEARRRADALIAQFSQNPTTTVMVNANGQTVTVPAGAAASAVAGIPNSYLVGGGVALLVFVYLLRR